MSGYSPFMKFIAPALLTIVAVFITAIEQGTVNGPAFEVAAVGLAASSVAFVVANNTHGLGRFAKALAPSLLTLLGIGIHWAVVGEWSEIDTRLAVAGLAAALVTFLVPNTPSPPQHQHPNVGP